MNDPIYASLTLPETSYQALKLLAPAAIENLNMEGGHSEFCNLTDTHTFYLEFGAWGELAVTEVFAKYNIPYDITWDYDFDVDSEGQWGRPMPDGTYRKGAFIPTDGMIEARDVIELLRDGDIDTLEAKAQAVLDELPEGLSLVATRLAQEASESSSDTSANQSNDPTAPCTSDSSASPPTADSAA